MIRLKSKQDIANLEEGGAILSRILGEIKAMVRPGVSSLELENTTNKLMKEAGGVPAFLGYAPEGNRKYPAALCMSVNEGIVHTPANIEYIVKEGEIVSLDLGFKYKGMITDMATSVIAGTADKKDEKLLETTKKCLEEAIKECQPGAPISAIGKRIESIAKGAGFFVIKELVGHGVGYDVHEAPVVLNYHDKNMDSVIMEEGLVIAIEPMLSLGSENIDVAEDSWTYITADKSRAGHFEATVAITANGPVIITPIV
ncbi:type I methionyl aminopeptidase [Candidatus Parcubacteria bacterium]|nr:type I methionyl aminopeptidase [Patescibacteria group bacterium]MCG2694154.1 type I methionyl aminopeptidase [Candidatus Parcubacteria bacterium]